MFVLVLMGMVRLSKSERLRFEILLARVSNFLFPGDSTAHRRHFLRGCRLIEPRDDDSEVGRFKGHCSRHLKL